MGTPGCGDRTDPSWLLTHRICHHQPICSGKKKRSGVSRRPSWRGSARLASQRCVHHAPHETELQANVKRCCI
jgi:hypothetical protein